MSNIEPKLKQLKVADLKDILQKASVTLPAKATKADLITKILATPAAVELFNKQNSSNGTTSEKSSVPGPPPPPVDNDLLSPPEQFEWESTTTTAVPASVQPKVPVPVKTSPTTAPAENPIPIKPSAPVATSTTPTFTVQSQSNIPKVAVVNDDLEKRKKRAERFGVPLVESKQGTTPKSKAASRTPGEDTGKLQTRAARFGVPVANSGQKRPAPPVDKEEEEKRKKRAERFGATTTKT